MNKNNCPQCGRFMEYYTSNTPSGDFDQLSCEHCGIWFNI